ncbi:MAG: PASTA domain-containing protein [Oscillospiraceae bacterium]|jgi:stage V sporulation protein D (sporulation-specific penicillin-binding protein)|nr:PASTA domain-containing protein [Oscillospiraceae bacterium]
MAKGTTIRMWRRSLLVLIILVAALVGVGGTKLVLLQLVQGKNLQQMAIEQQRKDIVVSAKRGSIYDRNMKPLAQSATVWTVVLEPVYIDSEEKSQLIASELSKILELDYEEVFKKTKENSSSVILKKKIENDVKDKILNFQKEKHIRNGIRVVEDHKRYYPYGCLASVVLGFTGTDNQGLWGLESYYDRELSGQDGRLVTARNASGTDMPFEHEQMISPKNGYSLVTSIDETVQHAMEKYLEEGRINSKSVNGATAIMMDVNNGEILGMAVKKDYDPNKPFELEDQDFLKALEALPENEKTKAKHAMLNYQWRNKAVTDSYCPGSTFKILTASMALEEGVVDENSKFHCTGGLIPFPGVKKIRCHKRTGHGSQTFPEAICHSCNPAFMKIGQDLGIERFCKYFRNFGLREKTGIDLPGETNGIFFQNMRPIDLIVSSFGQNFTITPIQMIVAVASCVNGGKLVQPHVVKQILDEGGNIIKTTDKLIKRQVISADTSRKMCELLQKNVAEGSGKNGNVPGFRIGGKTGTSEKKPDNKGPSVLEKYNIRNFSGGKDYVASFVAFAPSEGKESKYVLLVLYDTPRGNSYYGSQVAAPIAGKIFYDALMHLGVRKKYNEKELINLEKNVPFLVGSTVDKAKADIYKNELQAIIKGNGDYVVSQIPEAGEKIPKNAKVVIYTDEMSTQRKVKVPKFSGLSLADANKLAFNSDLNMNILGVTDSSNGEIVSSNQSIPVGEMVSAGTIITVRFVQKDTVE